MSKTRNNHYVPQWHQEGFLEPGAKELAYLDLTPEEHLAPDGRRFLGRSRFFWPPVKCFRQVDLYTTFFETTVNDEIERKLFGDVDRRGAKAIPAFMTDDPSSWVENFQTLFEYLDIQKIRTPKGLAWLRKQYPILSQNDLMREMQAIRQMHSRLWMEGVREIVSAQDAAVKFILSDHPVTIYNHAIAPDDPAYANPSDPSTALKGSQTLFPLNRDHCLILTNLEYAQQPDAAPLDRRTFARAFRQGLVRGDAFLFGRRLDDQGVAQINRIVKTRARRFVAAGREEWLHPADDLPWRELRAVLRPPADGLWRFGGEIFARFDNGDVHYQDAFGRAEAPPPYLIKNPAADLRPQDACGCGSGRSYRDCCRALPASLRPSWTEKSIRERNLMFLNALTKLLGLDTGKDWAQVRRDLTDETIAQIYRLYAALWPLETDLLALLPKPDGRARAIYTGSLHPEVMAEFAYGAAPYFGELLIQHPFTHAGLRRPEYSPTQAPEKFRLEVLKSLAIFLNAAPLVLLGLVNLVPDPCDFDPYLRDQMMFMARERTAGLRVNLDMDQRIQKATEDDARRGIQCMPDEVLRVTALRSDPGLGADDLDALMAFLERQRIADPLASLQAERVAVGEEGGLFTELKLSPNFEMALYLAQATGAALVTDSMFRWAELRRAVGPLADLSRAGARSFAIAVEQGQLPFVSDGREAGLLSNDPGFRDFPALIGDAFNYLRRRQARGPRGNFETQLAARFTRAQAAAGVSARKRQMEPTSGRLNVLCPIGGIVDNTVNRLLLTSSAEHALQAVPLAFYIERKSSQS